MAKYEFVLPAMGEGIIEATITRWFVKEGESFDEDEPLLEVATDKVDSEVPAPVSGVLSRIIYHEGEMPKIGEVLALIDDGNPEDEKLLKEDHNKLSEKALEHKQPAVLTSKKSRKKIPPEKKIIVEESQITPFIRFLARDRGISLEELLTISGSGNNGRITRDDLNQYIINGREASESFVPPPQKQNNLEESAPPEPGPGEEVILMDRTRQLIAEHMIRSKRTSPHVTSTVELDVTELVHWRESRKQDFFEKYGVKLTYTPVIVQAVVKALKQFPGINISVSGNYIIRKNYIHIGVATALPDGNLIVPVIKDADKGNFINIANTLADLVSRARTGKLEPVEVKGGTFTITNMGQYNNISGTPIINQPEVAILAVGAIKKKPAVVNMNGQNAIGIRDILVLSLTYDHRVIDGALGGSFVQTIGDCLVSELPDF